MPASNAFQSDIMGLLFGNSAIANIGSAGGLQPSSSAGSFYIALHTANPGAAGNQSTSEAAYTGYARVAVARAISASWTQTGSSPTTIENTAAVTFPACTGGPETETYFSIGYQSSGATKILAYGALTSSLAVSNGITPSFAINQLTCTVD
jgi:hypothetical protein